MRKIIKYFVVAVVLVYVVIQAWFIWPEYGHKLLYKFTISPHKVLSRDIVLHRDKLYAGINKQGNINYLSNGAWINTISSIAAPYIALKNPMAEKKPFFEDILYTKFKTFKYGNDITAVSFSGHSRKHPFVHIDTVFRVFGAGTIMINSQITSSKNGLRAWIGDRIKTNTRSILFYVPGVGDIATGARDAISPQKPYLAMLGRANQVIGFYYTGDLVPSYFFYQQNWIASMMEVKLADEPLNITRVLSTRSISGMDYQKVADSQYKNFLAVQSGLQITASSYTVISDYNKSVLYTVYVKNVSGKLKHVTGLVLFAPKDIMTSKPYTSISDTLDPGSTSLFAFKIKALRGGDFYIYPAILVNGNYIEGPWTHVFCNGPGWYSADMHNHSVYSFNPEDYPVRDMTEAAHAKGLDILSLTDYNTFSQAGACRAQSSADFLCIPGEEIANPLWGHANAQFIHKKVYEFLSPQHWIDDVHAQGGMFFVNHPYLEMRQWRDWNFKGYDGIEILNGNKIPMDPVNVKAFDKWDELNRTGLHLYGIADSDAHTPYAVGRYRNYVYATSFTPSAIENGFKKGMFYVTNGPMLSFTINDKPMGSVITVHRGDNLHIRAAYESYTQAPENAPDIQKIQLFKDGYILASSNNSSLEYDYRADKSGFYRVEIFTNDGGFAASNPVWVNVK